VSRLRIADWGLRIFRNFPRKYTSRKGLRGSKRGLAGGGVGDGGAHLLFDETRGVPSLESGVCSLEEKMMERTGVSRSVTVTKQGGRTGRVKCDERRGARLGVIGMGGVLPTNIGRSVAGGLVWSLKSGVWSGAVRTWVTLFRFHCVPVPWLGRPRPRSSQRDRVGLRSETLGRGRSSHGSCLSVASSEAGDCAQPSSLSQRAQAT
jgi:hypothetical protein